MLHRIHVLTYSCFSLKDFEIDEESYEYRALHPVASQKQPSLVEEHFEPVMEDEDQSDDVASPSELSDEEPSNEDGKTKKSRIR